MIVSVIAAIDSVDDRAFMTQVYEDFWRLMFSAASGYCNQPADREDLVQESLIRLIGHVDTLRTLSRSALASYIVVTVKNTCFTKLAREKRAFPECVSWEESVQTEKASENFAQELIDRLDQAAQVEWLWQKVAPEERFLLECRYLLDYSDKELARYLNCKPSSVRMKLTRARRKAAALLKDWEGGEDNE